MASKYNSKTSQYGLHLNVEKPKTQEEISTTPKSPVTIQEWIDSIEFSQIKEDELITSDAKDINESEDFLKLGAEAQHLYTGPRNVPMEMDSRLQTVLATLDYDPEEVLYNLGFGSDLADSLTRIPKRFFQHSQTNEEALKDFLKRKYEQCELTDAGFCGYRGLSGYQIDSPHFSGIVLKCLHRIRDATRNLERNFIPPTVTVTQPASAMSFFRAVYSVLAVNTFRNSINRDSSSNQSILEPENRAFIDNQSRPRKRHKGKLILEKNSVAIDADEDVFSDESADFEPELAELITPIPIEKLEQPKTPSHWHRLRKTRFDKENFSTIEIDHAVDEAQTLKMNVRKKPLRIQRQRSVDEDRSSDQESLIQPQIKLKTQETLLKCTTSVNKDSFELEELQLADDITDEDPVNENENRHFLKSCDILRTESAVSDSSGFLDGETTDGIGILTFDDMSLGFQPIMESTVNFPEENDFLDKEESCSKEEENKDCSKNVAEDQGEQIINKWDAINVDETPDGETRNDTDELLSNLVDNPPQQRIQSTNSEPLPESFNELAHKKENYSNLGKAVSSLDFSQYKTYFSPFSRFKWLNSQMKSMEDICDNQQEVNVTNCDKLWSPWRDYQRSPLAQITSTEQVQEFHQSCMSVIENMQRVVQSYSVKLKIMERMCWESYHSLFPGSSVVERQELEKLDSLRNLILLEATKTKQLLKEKSHYMKESQKTSYVIPVCDRRIVDVALEMKELVQEQDKLLLQMQEPWRLNSKISDESCLINEQSIKSCSSMQQSLLDTKEALLMDIKSTMKADNELFLNQLQATRQGIEDLKSVLSKFLIPPDENK